MQKNIKYEGKQLSLFKRIKREKSLDNLACGYKKKKKMKKKLAWRTFNLNAKEKYPKSKKDSI